MKLLFAGPWRGTTTQLLAALHDMAHAAERHGPDWPSTACKLSNALRRLAPNLRVLGVEVEFTRCDTRDRQRLINVQRVSEAK